MDITVLKSFTICLTSACAEAERHRGNELDNEFFRDATVGVVC